MSQKYEIPDEVIDLCVKADKEFWTYNPQEYVTSSERWKQGIRNVLETFLEAMDESS